MNGKIPAGFFRDALDPTDEELIRWGFTEGALYPPEMPQDWDLCITVPSRRDIFLRLAGDAGCSNRKFFLSCLYLLVGDAARTGGKTWDMGEVVVWLRKNRRQSDPDLQLFFQRALHLMGSLEEFDYNKWCDGGYAYEPIQN